MKNLLALSFFVLLLFTGCNPNPINDKTELEIWLSKPEANVWLHKETSVSPVSAGSAEYTINIKDGITYQSMDGFGASLTDSSCWLLYSKLTETKRNEVLHQLFGPEGIHMSLLRQPMGACDFNWEAWTFDDTNDNRDDWNLDNFSLWREDAYIRPILDQAYQIEPGHIKIMASPWSPPAWMRSNKSLFGNGGYLCPECYQTYAKYFVKYIQQYNAKGTPVYAVTIQNEPKNPPDHYPGMVMYPEDQIGFIRDYLGPEFTQNGITTKIICYDHNYDDITYPQTVMASAGDYCAGVAFHPYCPVSCHSNLTIVHNSYPDKGIWLTECGTGAWVGDENAQFKDLMMHSIRFPRNYSKSIIFWNVALDQEDGPKLAGVSNQNCGLITINKDDIDDVTYNASFYAMGHTSKFVEPGAVRIDSNSYDNELEDVAYKNPDGSIVLVLTNPTIDNKIIKIQWGKKKLYYEVPGGTTITFKWQSSKINK